jgi:hypothetical protein
MISHHGLADVEVSEQVSRSAGILGKDKINGF